MSNGKQTAAHDSAGIVYGVICRPEFVDRTTVTVSSILVAALEDRYTLQSVVVAVGGPRFVTRRLRVLLSGRSEPLLRRRMRPSRNGSRRFYILYSVYTTSFELSDSRIGNIMKS